MNAKLFTIITALLFSSALMAQSQEGKYHMSGGFLLGGNYSWLQLKDYPDNFNTIGRFGFAGGVFANFPLGLKFSVQPEALYSVMGGKIDDANDKNNNLKQKLYYASVPILVKYHIGNSLALFAGPQADYLIVSMSKVGNGFESDNT